MRGRDAEWLAVPLCAGGRHLRTWHHRCRTPVPTSATPAGSEPWFAGFDGPIDYEISDLTVTAGSDIAVCHSLNRLSATPHGGPDRFELWFRATVGLRKINGSWLVFHEHNSTPFYMDGSLRAAVDLAP